MAPGPEGCPRCQAADLPVGFAQILKIVHVAACGWVLGVQSLPLLGVGDLDEVPVVLDHKLAPGELLGGDHSPALAVDEVNLWRGERCFLTRGRPGCPGPASPSYNSFAEVCPRPHH